MYDNGVISFKQPGTEGALSPWQWDSRELKDAMASYFIASLWADIAPVNGTTYTTKGDGSSMTYSWNNISQYYGGAPALNTFSTTIKADGSIATSYYSLGLNATNVSVGTVGDHTQGQYDQKYYAPFGTLVINGTIPNWGAVNQVDPCKDNPLYSPTCPGYGAAYVASIQPQQSITQTAEPTSTSTTPVTEVVATPVQTTTSAPAQTAPVQTTTVIASPAPAQASATRTESTGSKPTVSLSTILSIVSAEQNRLSNVEKSVVQESVAVAVAASQTTRESAESTAASASVSFTGNGITVASLTNNSSKSLSAGSSFSMSTTDRMIIDFTPERIQENVQQSQQNDSVKKNVQNNDLARGVSITALASQPVNYSSYFTALPDNQFYQPKDIYRKQSVVDNARALRQMTSDRLHRDLVDLQYNKKGN